MSTNSVEGKNNKNNNQNAIISIKFKNQPKIDISQLHL